MLQFRKLCLNFKKREINNFRQFLTLELHLLHKGSAKEKFTDKDPFRLIVINLLFCSVSNLIRNASLSLENFQPNSDDWKSSRCIRNESLLKKITFFNPT